MLNISIVLYHPNWDQEVLPLVQELLRIKSLRKTFTSPSLPFHFPFPPLPSPLTPHTLLLL